MEVSSTARIRKEEKVRRNNRPAKVINYDSVLEEAKKIQKEKKARNEEITKLLREEKEKNTTYR